MIRFDRDVKLDELTLFFHKRCHKTGQNRSIFDSFKAERNLEHDSDVYCIKIYVVFIKFGRRLHRLTLKPVCLVWESSELSFTLLSNKYLQYEVHLLYAH